MLIHFHYKFHEILFLGFLVMAQLLIVNQYKGNNSCTSDAFLTKLKVHQRIVVIYIHIKVYQIPLIGYLVMAPDGHDEWAEGHGENYIPPPPAGDNNVEKPQQRYCLGTVSNRLLGAETSFLVLCFYRRRNSVV